MSISYEVNQYGEQVKVTRVGNSVSRELCIPVAAPPYKRYSFSEFLALLTDDEWSVIEELANGSGTVGQARKAKRLLRYWQHAGVDFNDATYTAPAITWLVNNTVEWTPERALALRG